MVGLDRRVPFFGRGKASLPRAVVAVAAVLLALGALGFLIWALVTRSAGRLAWLVAMATILAVVLPAWAMSAQMLAWVRRNRPEPDRVPQLRPLAGLDPFDLGVHQPVEASTGGQLPDLPQYVPRDHDVRLRQVAGEAAGGASQLVVLVGGSSTGKTRACWEMLASLPGRAWKTRPPGGLLASLRGRVPQWLLWHPIYPTRPAAVLAGLSQVGPDTVVWLDEAQLYLDTPDDTGERVAAGLRELLRDPRCRPVLVVATLWPEHWNTLTTRADPDRHVQARELLSGHNIDAPERFSAAALSKLAEEAGTDPRLAAAAAQAADGQITQYLAGAPVLLDHYQHAPPGARALIWTAMDARRLGCGPHLPLALLEAAAPGYLTDTEWEQQGDDHWLDQALAYATQLCNGIPGPLTRIRPRNPGPHRAEGAAGTDHDGPPLYRLADYLDQHGRRHRRVLIPPPSFWTAAPCAQPPDLTILAAAARARGLYRDAAQLLKSTAARGDPRAGADLVAILHDLHPGDHRPAQWVTLDVALALGDPFSVAFLLDRLREAGAQDQVTALLARDPAAHAALEDPAAVASLLLGLREAGAQDQVTALAAGAAGYSPSATRSASLACWTACGRRARRTRSPRCWPVIRPRTPPSATRSPWPSSWTAWGRRAHRTRSPRCWPVIRPRTPPSATRSPSAGSWTACGRRAHRTRSPRWPLAPPPIPPSATRSASAGSWTACGRRAHRTRSPRCWPVIRPRAPPSATRTASPACCTRCGRRAHRTRSPRCWPVIRPRTPPSTTRPPWPSSWTGCGRRAHRTRSPRCWPVIRPRTLPSTTRPPWPSS